MGLELLSVFILGHQQDRSRERKTHAIQWIITYPNGMKGNISPSISVTISVPVSAFILTAFPIPSGRLDGRYFTSMGTSVSHWSWTYALQDSSKGTKQGWPRSSRLNLNLFPSVLSGTTPEVIGLFVCVLKTTTCSSWVCWGTGIDLFVW